MIFGLLPPALLIPLLQGRFMNATDTIKLLDSALSVTNLALGAAVHAMQATTEIRDTLMRAYEEKRDVTAEEIAALRARSNAVTQAVLAKLDIAAKAGG